LADALIWRLFYQLAMKPHIFGEKPMRCWCSTRARVDIPAALDYLESQLPADGFAFGELSIADISIASFFRTASFVRYTIDAARWPRCAGSSRRCRRYRCFQACPFEDCMLRLPLAEQRAGALICRRTADQRPPGYRRATRPVIAIELERLVCVVLKDALDRSRAQC
jgi:glutathione S-transferase